MYILLGDEKLTITAKTIDPSMLTLYINRGLFSMQDVYELFEKNNLEIITIYNDDDTLNAVYTRYTVIDSFFFSAVNKQYVINLVRPQEKGLEESVKDCVERVDELSQTVLTMQNGDFTNQSEYALQMLTTTFTDEQALNCILLFAEWDGNGVAYKKNVRFRYGDKLFKVLQDHTSQPDWIPGAAPSLYVEVANPAIEYPEYKKPTGAHDAYNKGDKMTYKGNRYISKIDGNTYTPEEYPAGWELVESAKVSRKTKLINTISKGVGFNRIKGDYSMRKIEKETLARTVVLIVALLNNILAMAGYNPLPFSDDEVYMGVTAVFTVAASLWAWWKNNSFTEKAIEADKILHQK